MYCYSCKHFNQCPYKNQFIFMPYYYRQSYERDEPGMGMPPIEMSGEPEPNYIPPEPPGGTYDKNKILMEIKSCQSGWVYIWTITEDSYWAKIKSYDSDSVTTTNHGTVSYDMIRKIVCHNPAKMAPPSSDFSSYL